MYILVMSSPVYDKKVLTVPLISDLQTGQLLSAGAQVAQQTKWPQGRKTMFTSASIHILQVLWSFRAWFSSNRVLLSAK